MIALDTNILVRFITRDEPSQAAEAEHFLRQAKEDFFVSVPVLLELVWLLDRRFQFDRDEIAQVLRALYERADFVFEDAPHVVAAVSAFERGADFADHLIYERALAQGCSRLATFDEDLAGRHPHFVVSPRQKKG